MVKPPLGQLDLATSVQIHPPDIRPLVAERCENYVPAVRRYRRMNILTGIRRQLSRIAAVRVHYPDVRRSARCRAKHDSAVGRRAKSVLAFAIIASGPYLRRAV